MSFPLHIDPYAVSAKNTAIANHCEAKIKAWNRVTRSLVDLIALYDGQDFKTEIESLYANIATIKADRCEHLIEIASDARDKAARALAAQETEW